LGGQGTPQVTWATIGGQKHLGEQGDTLRDRGHPRWSRDTLESERTPWVVKVDTPRGMGHHGWWGAPGEILDGQGTPQVARATMAGGEHVGDQGDTLRDRGHPS